MKYTNLCPIVVERNSRSKDGTLSRILFDGQYFVGLEPYNYIVPSGNYLLTLTHSPRFSSKYPYNKVHNAQVPLINGVPGHSGVRIHVGNYVSETEGCLLIGSSVAPGMIKHSSVAYQDFLKRMQEIESLNPNVFYVINFSNCYE